MRKKSNIDEKSRKLCVSIVKVLRGSDVLECSTVNLYQSADSATSLLARLLGSWGDTSGDALVSSVCF